jgi:hypothetical protein
MWRRELLEGIWWGDLTETDHLEDLGVDGKKLPKCMFKKYDCDGWNELMWLRIGASGGLF